MYFCALQVGRRCCKIHGFDFRTIIDEDKTSMLHYTDRKDKVYILSLDDILAVDICKRLSGRKKMRGVEFVVAGDEEGKFSVEALDRLAQDTLTGRLLIMDVRSQTLSRLQQVYNKVIGYNRADLNHYCHTICIGDGPVNLFEQGNSLEAFGPHLAKMRLDFNAALYFFDPLLHYDHDEKRHLGIDRQNLLLETIPQRLEKTFAGKSVTVRRIRPYFRADKATGKKKRLKKQKRRKELAGLFTKMATEAFGEGSDEFTKCLSSQGYAAEGEALKLNVYPFYFEKLACKLLGKARAAVGG